MNHGWCTHIYTHTLQNTDATVRHTDHGVKCFCCNFNFIHVESFQRNKENKLVQGWDSFHSWRSFVVQLLTSSSCVLDSDISTHWQRNMAHMQYYSAALVVRCGLTLLKACHQRQSERFHWKKKSSRLIVLFIWETPQSERETYLCIQELKFTNL